MLVGDVTIFTSVKGMAFHRPLGGLKRGGVSPRQGYGLSP